MSLWYCKEHGMSNKPCCNKSSRTEMEVTEPDPRQKIYQTEPFEIEQESESNEG